MPGTPDSSEHVQAANRPDTVLEFDIRVDRRDFSLQAAGSFGAGITAVFGPSGAGKSTLLGAIAGSVSPSTGEISLFGRTLVSTSEKVNLAPERRRVGFVYQDAALFPHMTVEKNIAYGHSLTPKEKQRLDPADLAELLAISHLKDRKPAELSGGEKQRVALARTLATSPELLLLDEPMSALDMRLRGIVLGYLKLVHRELAMPMIYVSHSISEVLAIADAAMVLNRGKVRAFDAPRRLLGQVSASPVGTGSPADDTADFTVDNILEGQVTESHTNGAAGKVRVGTAELTVPTGYRQFGEKVVVAIGSQEIIVATERPVGISARNVLAGTISSIDGDDQRRVVTVDCGAELMAEVTVSATSELGLRTGKEVYLVIKSSSITVMDAFNDHSAVASRPDA